jgi:hypothetical protein
MHVPTHTGRANKNTRRPSYTTVGRCDNGLRARASVSIRKLDHLVLSIATGPRRQPIERATWYSEVDLSSWIRSMHVPTYTGRITEDSSHPKTMVGRCISGLRARAQV